VRKDWRNELGISRDDLAKAILKHPQLAGLNPSRVRKDWHNELGISRDDLARAILMYPPLAGHSPSRLRKDWYHKLGISRKYLARAILKFPPLAGYSLKNNIKPKIELLKAIGVVKNNMLDALMEIVTFNVKTLQSIASIANEASFKIMDVKQLEGAYRRLNRMFKAAEGCTVSKWIKGRRDDEIIDKLRPLLLAMFSAWGETGQSPEPSDGDIDLGLLGLMDYGEYLNAVREEAQRPGAAAQSILAIDGGPKGHTSHSKNAVAVLEEARDGLPGDDQKTRDARALIKKAIEEYQGRDRRFGG